LNTSGDGLQKYGKNIFDTFGDYILRTNFDIKNINILHLSGIYYWRKMSILSCQRAENYVKNVVIA
jgi:hypothetical protein